MALTDKLKAIADAIREKTGSTTPLFLDAMPSHIRSIQTTSSDTTGIPDDIVAEANRVASGMISKMGSNSLTFIAMSDTHEMGASDSTDTTTIEQISRGNRNAGQAAKLISDKIPLDFFVHLGDFAWASSTSTMEDGVSAIRRVREYIAEVSLNNETFITPGNHDLMTYSYEATGEYLSDAVAKGLMGDYRYLDFETKKVRVICLNTADLGGVTVTAKRAAERISGEQLQWFCQALDLSTKSNPEKWGIVILSHHPLDWAAIKPAGNVVAAYLQGGSFSANHEGVAVSYNFSGKNSAEIIAQFHGHVHGFRVDYINDLRTGTAVPTTAKRVAIPNACYTRNNEYGRNDATEYNDIEFGEETTYNKSDNSTGKNTAFCLVSIDLDEKVIYADCFGAGYDRVVSYAEEVIVTYSVTNNLSHANNSNGTTTVTEGANYSASITASEGYTLSSVTVTMGGVDITSTAVSGGNIAIANVTGDIVITAITEKIPVVVNYTNLVPTSLAADGSVYNGVGYKDGAYVSSGGNYGTDTASGCTATGFISYKSGDVIYIKGGTLSSSGRARLYFQESLTSASAVAYFGSGEYTESAWTKDGKVFQIEKLGDKYYKLTPNSTMNSAVDTDDVYRLSLYGKGEDLIITHNEPIE